MGRPDVGPTSPDPPRALAFEDQHGGWWSWEPATVKLYNDTPWLYTDFYYRVAAQRDCLVDTEARPMRFTPLTSHAAGRLARSKCVGGGPPELVEARRRQDGLLLETALRSSPP